MAGETRRLGDAVASDLGGTERGRRLQQDTTELAVSVSEFRQAVRGGADRFQVRRSYAGLDATWHHLAAELSRSGTRTPSLDRAVARVAETDARFHEALGINAAPAGYYAPRAPTGVAEVQRLAHSLVDRADGLTATVRADMTGPGVGRALQDAANLAALADTFHDSLRLEGQVDATIANGYSGVAGQVDRLAIQFTETPPPPRVQAAFQGLRSVDVLLRQALGMRVETAATAGTLLVPSGPSPVVALADQLVQQVTAFLQVFSATGGRVPEGAFFLADAQALQAAAEAFRQSVAASSPPGQLAFEFRNVDVLWQRLARRTNRIARGRVGPNIEQVARIGQTVADIHRLLGIPGYPPVISVGP
jgi:hypothetical protein